MGGGVMTASSDEASKPHTIHFQLGYITSDFEFSNKQISMIDPERGMTFLLRKRLPDDAPLPPLEATDGFANVTCEREMTVRLYQEAVSSGQLSIKKESVRSVQQDMSAYMRRMIRLIRWRVNSEGRPNPFRSGLGFEWSFDGSGW